MVPAVYGKTLVSCYDLLQFLCPRCDKYFYETAFWRHMALVHPSEERLRHACPTCGKRFPQLGKLRQHSLVHLADEEKPVACPQCDKRFANEEKLRSHVRAVHRGKQEGSFACSECGVTYRSVLLIQIHGIWIQTRTQNFGSIWIRGYVISKKFKDIVREKQVSS